MQAGCCPNNRGYKRIRVDGGIYYSHRLAYYMGTGIDPGEMEIDHIDGDPSNNRLANLRLATRSQNMMNRRMSNANPLKAKNIRMVDGKYYARVVLNKQVIEVGRFTCIDDAKAAVAKSRKSLHRDFANHG
jgi:hypothetical protein